MRLPRLIVPGIGSVLAAVAASLALSSPALADSATATSGPFSTPLATGTTTVNADGVDYCDDDDYIDNDGPSEIFFGGTTTCSEGSVVVNVYLIAWQKNPDGSYTRLRTVELEPGSPTPYSTGRYYAPCTPGRSLHTQYWTRVLTPEGVYITDTNTANTSPITCTG